ncbi:MAG: hypothetical protein CVU56_14375 [Deltaproteobacteria bacterium HGW-Deltaproteobacteria-14]|nr:MAG: hypothetical protein CVU56_14375 [Deltaproteobacteria bacterium HGW-Deltaproteobacteria-14]
MKQWTRILLVGLAGLSLTFAACGDDGTTTTTDTSVADTSTAGDTSTTDVAAATNQCTNAADLARIQDTTKPDPSAVAGQCGTGVCISFALSGDFDGAATCAATCMKDGDTDASIEPVGLSDGCTDCYVGAVLCAAEHCLAKCASDANAQPCIDCRNGDNPDSVDCTQNFYDCSGLPQQ